MGKLNLHFDWNDLTAHLKQKAEDAVLEAAGSAIDDAILGRRLRKEAIKWLDEQVEPNNPFAELLSDAAIHAGVSVLHAVLDSLIHDLLRQVRAA